MPKLLYIGNFGPAHSTENHVAASFRSLGWDVIQAQEDELRGRATWTALWQRAHEADLVLYTTTHRWGLPPDQARTLWSSLRARAIPTAALHLDLFFGIPARERTIGDHPLFQVQDVFTADGDPHPWSSYGIRHHWLRPGVYADECKPGTYRARWSRYTVAFVGTTSSYHREWPYRERMLSALGDRFGDKLLVYPRAGQPAIRGWALNDLFASVPVFVGDSMSFERVHARYWSDRAYEVTGRGGFLVMPRIDALREELREVPSIRWYEWDDYEGLCDLVASLAAEFRKDPAKRVAAVEQGSRWVRMHASYANRVMEMLDVLGLPYTMPAWLAVA